MEEQRALDVGALAEACVTRVGCYGTNGVPVYEIWQHASAMAGDGTGALDPGCIQYLWEGIRSSAYITFARRRDNAEVAEVLEPPHLATDVERETIAVASAELAAESLGLHDPNITLNEIQQNLLQEVAQAGETGAMQNDLTKKLGIDARTIHYNVRHLEGFGLVKVQKALKSNVICLTRHYDACLCKLAGTGPAGSKLNVGASKGTAVLNYVAMAERVVAALRAARDCTLVESEVRTTLGMKGNAHRLGWAHIKRELEQRGAVSFRVTVNGRMQPCLHLKSSSSLANGGSEPKPAPELERAKNDQGVTSGSQVRAEETLQQQIYNMVIESGEEGITHADVHRKFGVPTKLSYSICCALVAANRLCVVAETIKGQCNYRLIGPAHFRAQNYAGVTKSSASSANGDEDDKRNSEASKFPRTVQQQQRRDKVLEYVNRHRMVWLEDVIQWMKSEGPGAIDKKVLTRLVTELENEDKVQRLFFSTRTSLRQQERQIQAIFAIGVPRDGPEVQAFVEAKAVKRRKISGKLENAPQLNVEVDHLPKVADQTNPRKQAAKIRIRRLELGFIEGRMARAKALHLYLWSCGSVEDHQFSMECVLKDMQLRDYAQLLGITSFDLPDIDDFLARDVKVSALPSPHCHTFINSRATFFSFKSMLEVLIKLGLLSPAMNSGSGDSASGSTRDKSTPTDDPVGVASDSQASFSHFALASTVRLPGHANGANVGGESPTGSASSHLALGTVAQFGIASKTPRDRAYVLTRDGELEKYWSDLQSYATQRSRASSTPGRDAEPEDVARANPDDIARQAGLSEIPELFRTRSWIVEKALSATQRADVERTIRAADMHPPFDFKAILQIAKSTKLPLVSLVAHVNNTPPPSEAAVASRLMPIRHRTGASSSVSAAVSGGPRKSRKRQSAARNRELEPAGSAANVGMAHEPDHVAAYMATTQAGRRKNIDVNAGLTQRQNDVPSDEKTSDDESDRVVPRRAAKLHWSSQMDMDLAIAYIAERNRVARSDKCYRVSWANIGVDLNVPPARARRRWTVLQKDPKFKQAITMAGNGSASQSSLLELILRGSNDQASILDTRLPNSVGAVRRSFHIRDGSSPVYKVGHIKPNLSAVMLALKAILLVPEDRCERDTAISLLTRFENSDIENAIKIMKAQHLLTSVKGAKANSRAFRLSPKFYESRKLVAENYQRDIFEAMRAASDDIRSKFESEDDESLLDDVDPVTGGGHAAVVLGQVVGGTLTLSAKSSRSEEERSIGANLDTANSTAPHASILSHLLLVGAVQQSADGRSGSEKANLSVHLPPWKIGMHRSAAARDIAESRSQQNSGSSRRRHESTTDWSRFELVDRTQNQHNVRLPDSIFEAASEIGIPSEIADGIFSAIHKCGREGATIEDVMGFIQPVSTTSRTSSTISLSAASQELVDFLAGQLCIVRVSAWDHHRYVSSQLDHVWSVPRQSDHRAQSEEQDTVAESAFPFASALTSWTRIDSGVDAPLLRSLRQAIAALIMKHPGMEEEAIRTRIENIHPREVQDLLTDMVDEGLLRSRDRRVLAQRTSLFHAPTWETVRCYWALPEIHSGCM